MATVATSTHYDQLIKHAKETSSLIKDIFNLTEKIDSPEFFEILSQKTTELENLIGDLQSTISRMKQYINSRTDNNINNTGYVEIFPAIFAVFLVIIILLYSGFFNKNN